MSIDLQRLKALLAEQRDKASALSDLPFDQATLQAALALGPRLRWEIAAVLSADRTEELLAQGAERQDRWLVVPPLLRRDLLRQIRSHPQATDLLSSALHTLRGLVVEPGEPLERWQTLLGGVVDPLAAATTIGETLVRLVRDAVDRDISSAFAWMNAARDLDNVLGGALTPALLAAAYLIDNRHERARQREALRQWLPRPALVERFRQLLTPGARALHLVGPGGVGKTALVRHIASAPELSTDPEVAELRGSTAWVAQTAPYVTASIDFDHLDPSFPARAPALALQRLAEGLRRKVPELDEAALRHFDELAASSHAALAGRTTDPTWLLEEGQPVLRAFLDLTRAAAARRGMVVLIFDTCEELEQHGQPGTEPPPLRMALALVEMLFELDARDEGLGVGEGRLRVLFAGRRLLAKSGDGWEAVQPHLRQWQHRPWLAVQELLPFSYSEAQDFLRKRGSPSTELVLQATREPLSPPMFRDVTRNETEGYLPYHLDIYATLAEEGEAALQRYLERPGGVLHRYIYARILGRASEYGDALPIIGLAGYVDAGLLARVAPPGTPPLEELVRLDWLEQLQDGTLVVNERLRRPLLDWFLDRAAEGGNEAQTRLRLIAATVAAPNQHAFSAWFGLVSRDPARARDGWPAWETWLLQDWVAGKEPHAVLARRLEQLAPSADPLRSAAGPTDVALHPLSPHRWLMGLEAGVAPRRGHDPAEATAWYEVSRALTAADEPLLALRALCGGVASDPTIDGLWVLAIRLDEMPHLDLPAWAALLAAAERALDRWEEEAPFIDARSHEVLSRWAGRSWGAPGELNLRLTRWSVGPNAPGVPDRLPREEPLPAAFGVVLPALLMRHQLPQQAPAALRAALAVACLRAAVRSADMERGLEAWKEAVATIAEVEPVRLLGWPSGDRLRERLTIEAWRAAHPALVPPEDIDRLPLPPMEGERPASLEGARWWAELLVSRNAVSPGDRRPLPELPEEWWWNPADWGHDGDGRTTPAVDDLPLPFEARTRWLMRSGGPTHMLRLRLDKLWHNLPDLPPQLAALIETRILWTELFLRRHRREGEVSLESLGRTSRGGPRSGVLFRGGEDAVAASWTVFALTSYAGPLNSETLFSVPPAAEKERRLWATRRWTAFTPAQAPESDALLDALSLPAPTDDERAALEWRLVRVEAALVAGLEPTDAPFADVSAWAARQPHAPYEVLRLTSHAAALDDQVKPTSVDLTRRLGPRLAARALCSIAEPLALRLPHCAVPLLQEAARLADGAGDTQQANLALTLLAAWAPEHAPELQPAREWARALSPGWAAIAGAPDAEEPPSPYDTQELAAMLTVTGPWWNVAERLVAAGVGRRSASVLHPWRAVSAGRLKHHMRPGPEEHNAPWSLELRLSSRGHSQVGRQIAGKLNLADLEHSFDCNERDLDRSLVGFPTLRHTPGMLRLDAGLAGLRLEMLLQTAPGTTRIPREGVRPQMLQFARDAHITVAGPEKPTDLYEAAMLWEPLGRVEMLIEPTPDHWQTRSPRADTELRLAHLIGWPVVQTASEALRLQASPKAPSLRASALLRAWGSALPDVVVLQPLDEAQDRLPLATFGHELSAAGLPLVIIVPRSPPKTLQSTLLIALDRPSDLRWVMLQNEISGVVIYDRT